MIRKLGHDPRTVARNIPGIFEAIFPRLTPGVVAHYNQSAFLLDCDVLSLPLIQSSQLQNAMLFEIGVAVGENLIVGDTVDWENCVQVAIARQRRYFDVQVPDEIVAEDRDITERVGRNISVLIQRIAAERNQSVVINPKIPGFQWISSGQGDFSLDFTIIEVKCSSKNFSASDYRQIVMYWLLSFAASLEGNGREWTEGILLNPRSGKCVVLNFNKFLRVISAGRSKVDIFEVFSSIIGSRETRN